MSGPQDTAQPLDAADVEAMVDAAIKAIAAAKDSAQLKQARAAHAADKSPLALANRRIGSMPKDQRKTAGA